jgi:hypothetical protein
MMCFPAALSMKKQHPKKQGGISGSRTKSGDIKSETKVAAISSKDKDLERCDRI